MHFEIYSLQHMLNDHKVTSFGNFFFAFLATEVV